MSEQPHNGVIRQPELTFRPQRLTMGIRTITPFRGMFAVRDQLLDELRAWVHTHALADQGPYFLRYHVIDMQGDMDIEVGYVVTAHLPADGRVTPGVLPGGQYGTLTYTRYALRATKALLGWAHTHGIQWDRWDDPAGDAFRCRYEAYLTDYRRERKKTAWHVEFSIKTRDT